MLNCKLCNQSFKVVKRLREHVFRHHAKNEAESGVSPLGGANVARGVIVTNIHFLCHEALTVHFKRLEGGPGSEILVVALKDPDYFKEIAEMWMRNSKIVKAVLGRITTGFDILCLWNPAAGDMLASPNYPTAVIEFPACNLDQGIHYVKKILGFRKRDDTYLVQWDEDKSCNWEPAANVALSAGCISDLFSYVHCLSSAYQDKSEQASSSGVRAPAAKMTRIYLHASGDVFGPGIDVNASISGSSRSFTGRCEACDEKFDGVSLNFLVQHILRPTHKDAAPSFSSPEKSFTSEEITQNPFTRMRKSVGDGNVKYDIHCELCNAGTMRSFIDFLQHDSRHTNSH